MSRRRLIAFIAKMSLAAVFLYAGVLKIIEPVRFATDVSNYHLLPWGLGVALAFYLPWLEMVAALSLFSASKGRAAALILVVSLLIFVAATVAAWGRGIDLSCGCFGHAGRSLPLAGHLILDLVLLALAAFLLVSPRPDLQKSEP